MSNFMLTQRSFENLETEEVFNLWHDPNTGQYKLLKDNTEVNGFFIAAHSDITIKLNGTKVIKVNRGQFYNLKEGEVITHKKYCGFDKFTKVK